MPFFFIILALVAVAFFALQVRTMLVARRGRGRPAPSLAGEFGQAVAAGGRALFYFWSPACCMCRPMAPVIEALRRDSPSVFSIDVTADADAARAFGVMATPTTILVEAGVVREILLGPQPEARLRRWLEASTGR